MSFVRFASICDADGCDARSAEYQRWPECSKCYSLVCPDHMVPGSQTEDERNECVCRECGKEATNAR